MYKVIQEATIHATEGIYQVNAETSQEDLKALYEDGHTDCIGLEGDDEKKTTPKKK